MEASSYDDWAEVAWLTKVNDPTETVDSVADCGPARFRHVDMMLPSALQNNIRGGEWGREVSSKAIAMFKTCGLVTGRQATRMLAIPQAERDDVNGLPEQRFVRAEMAG